MAISTTAALIAGGSAILGSSAISSYFNAESADTAADAYAQAAAQYGASTVEALSFLDPYTSLGQEAISPLSSLLLGKSYDPETGEFTEISPDERLNQFQASPGYQFNLQQGQKALEASQAARGGLLSGRAGLEALQFGSGVASQEYNNYINQLMGLTASGQNAATASANTLIGAGSNLADISIASGLTAANAQTTQGNIITSATDQFLQLAGGSF